MLDCSSYRPSISKCLEGEPSCRFLNRYGFVEHVTQPVLPGSCSAPSEDANGLPFDIRTDVLGKPGPRAVADLRAGKHALKLFVDAHEIIETVEFLVCRIDKHVEVGVGFGLVAGVRAEQIERLH